ncbi:hypothetical protein [Clostridium botulinum]|uniref:hypothetical protein n=1 Tax=Clostridium botulinum TaxID=1491 RepID=UPI0004D60AFE|nr:hypothetical protein [Clostridium botulinum]KEH99975.1 hypothetical protein Z952_14740 [Clostridium botulinum C/D str. BKT75002]KEI05697.1 hypothetical protein Z954_14920 [Clostridium botulinum C/D str. BKT2873]MCD3351771.1 hypothetical protein [Clostridium botulinum D/C]MCD3360697.1 hypothetical protein [Clostridium botulinum D/C]MCD3362123.1 hypothetical protein [Clostridium botulinum D/C]
MIKSLIPILKENSQQILSYKVDTIWGETFNAFDGNLKGKSISYDSNNNYIGYNFKNIVCLCSYRIYPWFYASGSGCVNCPTGWILQ